MKKHWDERYSADEYTYGIEPSSWFKEIIETLPAGRVLIPGAGEGRDAVYAARLGWQVTAFDQSRQGKIKAIKLAMEEGVKICYEVADVESFHPDQEKYDLIALVFLHLAPEVRRRFHQKLHLWLNPGGMVVVESFHPRQVYNNSGGTKEISLLVTPEQLADDFVSLEIIENKQIVTTLNEGKLHQGKADVVRFLGKIRKKNKADGSGINE